MKLSAETLAFLGEPDPAALQGRFMDAVVAKGADGVTPRDMHRRNKDAPLLAWMQAGAALHRAGKLAHAWAPVKNDLAAAQESRYTLPTAQPPA